MIIVVLALIFVLGVAWAVLVFYDPIQPFQPIDGSGHHINLC
jgi:hypothetical protein